MKSFIFMSMLFCHIIDDYKLQPPLLNNLKQKAWWQKNAPDKLYRYDYIMALVMHAISWSFMIHLPIGIYYQFQVGNNFIVSFIINAMIHGVIDDLKANRHKLNLIADQLLHAIQIIITGCVLLYGG